MRKEMPATKTPEHLKFKIKVDDKDCFEDPIRKMSNESMIIEFNTQILKLLEHGLIKVVDRKFAKCISNALFVRKGSGWRLCIDYRRLNGVAEAVMSDTDSVHEKMNQLNPNSKFFAVLDLAS